MTDSEDEIKPITIWKLFLFVVWWFSGIGVGTAFMTPQVIGNGMSPEIFLTIMLTHFCSGLLIIALIPGKDDKFRHPLTDKTD